MPSRPNILIILADDHGYGDVTCYGGPNLQTPNLDRIAESGMRFTRFYANSSVCSPSRAALMTGRYPDLVGVPGVIRTHPENNWGYFDPAAITLPQMMGRAGYTTALFGKWHLGLDAGSHPCARGFEHFRGFLGDMMDDYYTHLRHGFNYMRQGEVEIHPEGHATDLFTDWSCEFIREQQESDRPFFLYLAYNAPHTPIQPPDNWVAKVKAREPEVSDRRAQYVALVEHMDSGIGRVLETLEETGALANTLVVYTSDNGGQANVGAFNGPLRGQKGDMYEGGIRVPACAMWPGNIQAGAETDQIAILMDLLPTACELAGVDVDHQIEGRSILPTLLNEKQNFDDRSLYWIRKEGNHDFLGLDQHAIRHGDLKLLHNRPFLPLEMYDLAADPLEENDLTQSEESQFKEMARLLRGQIQQAGSIPWQTSN
ncbi:MAG: sulfatase-like hydrolase/transferase [Planctomycetota bacterium]|jgi:arylsulfatase A-like enzyme|nr:sulfatase-like hydrolase/transferase [Planctomycetota bacterium]